MSAEAEHPAVGVEVRRYHGVAQCRDCRALAAVTRFAAVRTDGFGEAA